MPELTNAQRRLYKATYAPTKAEPSDRLSRGVSKGAFVAGLGIRPTELTSLKRGLGDRSKNAALLTAVNTIEALVLDRSPASALRYAPALASIDASVLVQFAKALAQQRASTARDVEKLVTQLRAKVVFQKWRWTAIAVTLGLIS